MSNIPGLFFLVTLIAGTAFGSTLLLAVGHSIHSFFEDLTAIPDKGKRVVPLTQIKSSFAMCKAIPRMRGNGGAVWYVHINGEGMRTEKYYR